MTSKKGGKAKHLSVDINEFLSESQFLKNSPTNKKNQKRQRNDVTEEDSIAKMIGQYQTNAKKKKLEVNVEACKESRQKILDVMSHQLETRFVNLQFPFLVLLNAKLNIHTTKNYLYVTNTI